MKSCHPVWSLFIFSLWLSCVASSSFGAVQEYRSVGVYPDPNSEPYDFAFAKDGTIWLANPGLHCLQHVTDKMQIIGTIGACGTTPGLLNNPVTIAVAPDTTLWTHDFAAQRIIHFKTDGTVIRRFDGVKPFESTLRPKMALALDGSLWLANIETNVIVHFSADGEVLGRIARSDSRILSVRSLEASPDGSLWGEWEDAGLTPGEYSLVDVVMGHYQANGDVISEFKTSKGPADPTLWAAEYSSLTPASDGTLWRFNRENTLYHLNGDAKILSKIKTPVRYSGLTKFAPDGKMWFMEKGYNRLYQFKADGSYAVNGDLYTSNLQAATDGTFWAFDANTEQLLHFRADQSLLARQELPMTCSGSDSGYRTFKLAPDGSFWFLFTTGFADGRFSYCLQHIGGDGQLIKQFTGIRYDAFQFAVAPDNSLWLSNFNKNQIDHLAPDGTVLDSIKGGVDANGEDEYGGLNLAVAQDGSLWLFGKLLDGYMVHHWFIDGSKENFAFGREGDGPDEFSYSGSIDVAADGTLWLVVRGSRDKVMHYTSDGQFLGQFYYYGVSKLALTRDGDVWIQDYLGYRERYSLQTFTELRADYSSKSEILSLPSVSVGNIRYLSNFGMVKGGSWWGESNQYLCLLNDYRIVLNAEMPVATYDVGKGLLTIPKVFVDGVAYSAELGFHGSISRFFFGDKVDNCFTVSSLVAFSVN